MRRQTIGLSLFIVLFAWMGVAEAASISTRVRILESKVSKFDKKAATESTARKAFETKVNKKLTSVDDLQKQVEKIVKQMEKKKKGQLVDKRYAFP
ncbi:MAG: hypothetical protein U9R28_07640 [Pseudomonadota bacterium]|nr:hypothetical protein [Pseudomonadota bacterium]